MATAPTTAAAVAPTDATPKSALLSIRNVAKSFGKNVVLREISLDIAEGEFLTILGESGSGKTTLLRIVAGFESASSGEVWMGDERLDRQPPTDAASTPSSSTTHCSLISRSNKMSATDCASPDAP